jgi:hypothetical protein
LRIAEVNLYIRPHIEQPLAIPREMSSRSARVSARRERRRAPRSDPPVARQQEMDDLFILAECSTNRI